MLFAQPKYFAQFSDTGGLNGGDKVRIAGVDIGQVQSFAIDGDKVLIGYTLNGTQIGTDSRAAIRTDTILGREDLGDRAARRHGVEAPTVFCHWGRPPRRTRSTTRSST